MVDRKLKRAGGRASRVAARKASQSEFDPSALDRSVGNINR